MTNNQQWAGEGARDRQARRFGSDPIPGSHSIPKPTRPASTGANRPTPAPTPGPTPAPTPPASPSAPAPSHPGRKTTASTRAPRSDLSSTEPLAFFISRETATSAKMVDLMSRRGIRCVTFEHAVDAINHPELSRVRVAVSDMREPVADDLSFYKILRSGEVSTSIPFVFLVNQDSKLSPRASGVSTLDNYLVMPVSARALCDTIQQAIVRHDRHSRAVSVPGNLILQGKIGDVSLPELIQFFQIGKKTGFLRVNSSRAKGSIAFVSGEIHHSEVGPIEGDEAFYLLMAIQDGSFEFEADIRPVNRTIRQNITNLLLEGMRQMDEIKVLLDRFADKAAEVETAKNKRRFKSGSGIFEENETPQK